jgi:hypothetical protein
MTKSQWAEVDEGRWRDSCVTIPIEDDEVTVTLPDPVTIPDEPNLRPFEKAITLAIVICSLPFAIMRRLCR